MRGRTILLLGLLCHLSVTLKAQQITFTGNVVDDSTGAGVEAATVYIRELNKGTRADSKGHFSFGNITQGKYSIEISAVGYRTQRQQVDLQERQSFTFTLHSRVGDLGRVSVVGKTKIKQVRESGFNVNAVDLGRISDFNSDLNQVLNRTTGIKIRENGGMGSDFSFSLNGFTGKQVRFFLDGIPIDNYGSSFTLNNLPVNIADRVEIYKGVVPLELGVDALGGAVNIITNKKDRNFLDAYYEFGSFNTHRLSVNLRKTGKSGFMFNIGAFGSYSDNSYKVNVAVADRQTGVYGPEKRYRHFHDGYASGSLLVEAGVRDKKYADYLLFGGILTGNKKEIQQGATMQRVVGQAFKDGNGLIPSFKYKKSNLIFSGLTFQAAASYNINENRSVDTSSKVYDWTGSYGYRNFASSKDGELNEKSIYVYDVRDLQASAMLKYDINENHSFVVNNIYSDYTRKENDEFKTIVRKGDPSLTKNIIGASYNLTALDRRLLLTAFVKQYFLKTYLESGDTAMISNSTVNNGYGVAGSYRIFNWLLAKASYEKAYRLPTADEMLGDGLLVLSNTSLLPEASKNFNIGLATNFHRGKHKLNIESNFIYRNAQNLIQSVVVGFLSKYENQQNIRIRGVDAQMFYEYDNKLTVDGNVTYQKSVNINKYDPPGTQIPNYLYGVQLPNVPIFYGNADVSYKFNGIIKKTDNVVVNVGVNYLDAFYLNWPVYGVREYKKSIPTQFTQNVAVVYSLAGGKYSFRLESRNISNVKVFDYYLVQKPGRSFSLRFRYLLK